MMKKIRFSRIIFLFVVYSLLFMAYSFSIEDQQFIYESKGRRDPFIPLMSADGYLINIEPEPDESQIILQGMVYDPQGVSYVIINGQVARENEIVGTLKILKIERDKVTVLKDNQKLELTVTQGDQ